MGAGALGSARICDYSLHNVKSRPAKVGDKLVTHQSHSGTGGFCAPEDRNVAVCVLPGTAGLWREKVAQTDPSGENAPRYIISDRPMTEEEWIRERCGE